MAKNFHTDNKAFMLYKDWEDIFQALDSSEEIGELVMAVKRAADLKSMMSQGILMKKLSRQLHQQIMQKKNLRV